jgi:hypothetical protein
MALEKSTPTDQPNNAPSSRVLIVIVIMILIVIVFLIPIVILILIFLVSVSRRCPAERSATAIRPRSALASGRAFGASRPPSDRNPIRNGPVCRVDVLRIRGTFRHFLARFTGVFFARAPLTVLSLGPRLAGAPSKGRK